MFRVSNISDVKLRIIEVLFCMLARKEILTALREGKKNECYENVKAMHQSWEGKIKLNAL